MIMWEPIAILCLVAADILLTYYLLYKLKTNLGKVDYEEAEANPVVKYFLKKFGLHKGIRISAFYTITAMTAILFYFSVRYSDVGFRNLLYFLLGVFFMMFMVHMSSIRYLGRKLNENKPRGGKRK